MNKKDINRVLDQLMLGHLRVAHEQIKTDWLGPGAKQSDVAKAKAEIQKRIEKLQK